VLHARDERLVKLGVTEVAELVDELVRGGLVVRMERIE